MVIHSQNNQQIQAHPVSPFVLWGQDNKVITLKVELRDVELPFVDLSENKMKFQSYGAIVGANDYQFEFDFFDAIDSKKSIFKVNENCIDFLLRKRKHEIWPRLTLNKLRRAWLKVNFEKSYWNDFDDEIKFDKSNEELEYYQRNDLTNLGSEMYLKDRDKLRRGELIESTVNRVEFSRKFYLILYNLIHLYVSVYLLTVLVVRYEGLNAQFTVCRDVQGSINFVCYLKVFEILHQVCGFVFNKDQTAWYLALNRIFIFGVLINYESRLINKPVVFFLVLFYAIFDIINYLYYTMRTVNMQIRTLRWLKCTIWIPVYPLIFLCEAVILMRSIPYYDETKRFTVDLPNQLNFSFSFLTVLRTYLFFAFTPVMIFTMNNFYNYRLRQLTPDEKANKKRV